MFRGSSERLSPAATAHLAWCAGAGACKRVQQRRRSPEYDALELKRRRRIDILDNSCDDNVDIAVDYDDFLDRASNDNHR